MKTAAIVSSAWMFAAAASPASAPESADESGTAVSPGQSALLIPASLEASGTEIGKITISNGSIFDLADPQENKMLFRLANRAHIATRPEVIRQQLLFQPGDDFSLKLIEESERILRSNRYIQEVSIQPARYDSGAVDINVATSDTWTLMPKLAISRAGGENKSAIGIKEMNLLGLGMAVDAQLKSDVDRDYRVLKFEDRNLGRRWYGLAGVYANNSDGHTHSLSLAKPFHSLDSAHTKGISFFDDDRIDSFYDRGEVIGRYRHQAKHYEVFTGWSKGLHNGWVRRYTTGLVLDENIFSPVTDPAQSISIVPEDRKLVYPFIGFELLEDDYEETSNLNQISRTEDVYLGTKLNAKLGLAQAVTGSDPGALLLNVAAQTAFGSTDRSALIIATELEGRWEKAGPQSFILSASAEYYKRQSDHHLLYSALTTGYGHNLDLDRYFLLGGDSGVRGYPLRYQTGDQMALLTVEQRYFTDWYPWRLFRLGGAVFFDLGRAWGDAPVVRSENGLLMNVGVGLRVGNARSGLGRMTHIDIALPLDGGSDIKSIQFLVATEKSF